MNGPRAEVVGSLLRPRHLKDAVARHAAGELSGEALEQARERAVRDAVALQEQCGIEVITDGEMRRTAWSDPLTAGLAGFGRSEQAGLFSRASGAGAVLPALTGPVAFRRNLALEEVKLARRSATRPVKPTLPSPSYAALLYLPGVSERAYPSPEEYLEALMPVLHRVVDELAHEGCDHIQLDCPRYTTLLMASSRRRMREQGLDPDDRLRSMIELDNRLIDSFARVSWAMHVCRGNHRSTWYAEGGYDLIAERLFSELHVDRLLLEYDTPRAGSFEPLRFVSEEKTVVLGLLSTKEPRLEGEDAVIRRIEEATAYLPVERLALSPQCGFASTFEGNLLSEQDQRRKLELVARVAARVWG